MKREIITLRDGSLENMYTPLLMDGGFNLEQSSTVNGLKDLIARGRFNLILLDPTQIEEEDGKKNPRLGMTFVKELAISNLNLIKPKNLHLYNAKPAELREKFGSEFSQIPIHELKWTQPETALLTLVSRILASK